MISNQMVFGVSTFKSYLKSNSDLEFFSLIWGYALSQSICTVCNYLNVLSDDLCQAVRVN